MTNDTTQVHHADCGDVGETGVHGDLGSNAAGAEREAATAAAPQPVVKTENATVTAANSLVTHNTGAK
jgi:hypothetical protein